jgi:membrane protein insertase Oxa1/YidC/SpoIIIJ
MMVLSACVTEPITSESTGYGTVTLFLFLQMIVWLSELFLGNYGLGIIALRSSTGDPVAAQPFQNEEHEKNAA